MFLLKFLFCFLCTFFSCLVSADHLFVPYVGLDLQQKNMNFEKNYGSNVFVRKFFQNNIYLGVRVNKYFGLEGGYQSSQKQSKQSIIRLEENLLGQPVNAPALGADGFISTETSMRTKGYHLSAITFFPVENGKTEFIASVGMHALTVKAEYKQLADSDLQAYQPQFITETTRYFSSTRVIPRCMIGAQRHFTESLGVRASFLYELTSRFKKMAAKNPLNQSDDLLPGDGALRASLRNSITYGLGVFMNF